MFNNNSAYSALGIPIDCIGRPGGTELSPQVFREEGLIAKLGMKDGGDLNVRIDCDIRDNDSGIVGIESVCRTTKIIRSKVNEMLEAGQKPFLFGGCCTALIGAIAGARDHFGQIGLAYADGHIDLYDGHTSPTGEAADIPIAALLGYAPQALMDFIGPQPPLLPEHVALLGYRDLEEAKSCGSLVSDDVNITMAYDTNRLRQDGTTHVGESVQLALTKNPGQYWLHLDFDVLDEIILPCTDYLMPDGLDWDELLELLMPLTGSSSLIGVSIACYNPTKDPHRIFANEIVDNLGKLFCAAKIPVGRPR